MGLESSRSYFKAGTLALVVYFHGCSCHCVFICKEQIKLSENISHLHQLVSITTSTGRSLIGLAAEIRITINRVKEVHAL